MELFLFVALLALSGLVVGALGRLSVPGPDPMSIGMTILVGIGGSLIGGIIGRLLFRDQGGVPFIFAVGGAALLVLLIRRRRR